MATITSVNITDFISELALLLESGISCNEALKIIRQENSVLQKLIDKISADLENGSSLADSFAKYPQYFEPFLVDLIQDNGETNLTKIAQYRETLDVDATALTKKILMSSAYLISLVCITIIIISLSLIYVVPVFANMFTSFGGELPGLTQSVMNLSSFFVANWLFITIGIIIFCGLILMNWQLLTLYIPPFNGLYRKIIWIRCLRTWSFMLSEGTSMSQAIAASAQIVRNSVYTKRLTNISQQDDITAALTGYFPEKIIHAILVGQRTNKLDILLAKLADYYTKQLNIAIEPAIKIYTLFLIMIIGSIIGILIISMYLPIFTMGGQL
ncbi:MAG: type II secretion system F family protein [Candidatus Marithrix sp.]